MKLLLLLTAAFPYDKGEDFLPAELHAVSGFDKILVCPCNLKEKSTVTKTLPTGILVYPLSKQGLGKAAYAKLLFSPPVLQEMIDLVHSGRFSFSRLHEMLFFMKNAVQLYESMLEIPEVQAADDITIYSYWFYDAAAAGALLAQELKRRGKRVKQISRAHGFDIHPERSLCGYLPMRKFLLSSVDRLYPCSQNGADTICRQYPEYRDKVRPAFLGTADCGVTGGKRHPELHLVSCSYMVPVKRLHLLIQALSLCDFPVRWTHLGSGPLEQELRQQAEKLPQNVNVNFAGQLENTAILDFYRSNPVSVFVNVSSSEGIPVSIMEAISFGIPVVATNVGGTSEAVRDGFNGFLLEKDFTPRSLMEKIRQIRDLSDAEYKALCVNSRAMWEKKFHASVNYSRFYEEISK